MWDSTVQHAVPSMALGRKSKFGDRQASSDHGQRVGNNSADQNSSAPRMLALTLKQSPEMGQLIGGQRRVTLPTEETIGTTGSHPWIA